MADEDLHPILEDIQNKIVGLREDIKSVVGQVKQLRETVEEGIEKILEAIQDAVEAQAELQLMEKVARIRSIPAQIEAEEEQIEMEKDELEAKLESIGDRYEDRHAELDRKAKERIRDLGEHIFEIQEEEFEANVERPFTEHVTATWRRMQRFTRSVGDDRTETLTDELDETRAAIDSFLEHRSDLLSRIDEHRASIDLDVTDPRRVQIPFWTITIERGDETERRLVVPARFDTADDDWYAARLDEYDGFEPVFEAAAETEEHTTTEQLAPEAVTASVGDHAPDRLGGTLSFDEELEAALPETLDVGVATGGDRE